MHPWVDEPRFIPMDFTRVLARIECTIDGEPISKARARVTRKGTFTPTATRKYEATVAKQFFAARYRADGWPVGGWYSPDVQYAVEIRFVVSTFAGDIDNKVKSIIDAANKLLWPDDTRVVALLATKRKAAKGEAPHAKVRIFAVTASDKRSEDLAKRPVKRRVRA